MGMFDSVFVKCPNCGANLEFQTKVGDCGLHKYDAERVPVLIAAALDKREEECRHCKALVTITIDRKPAYFAMKAHHRQTLIHLDEDESAPEDPNW